RVRRGMERSAGKLPRLFVVPDAPVEASQRQRRVVPSAQLRPEVEPSVARVDLPPSQGEPVGVTPVHAGLAADRDPIARVGYEAELALSEQPSRVTERLDASTEVRLEVGLRSCDL